MTTVIIEPFAIGCQEKLVVKRLIEFWIAQGGAGVAKGKHGRSTAQSLAPRSDSASASGVVAAVPERAGAGRQHEHRAPRGDLHSSWRTPLLVHRTEGPCNGTRPGCSEESPK